VLALLVVSACQQVVPPPPPPPPPPSGLTLGWRVGTTPGPIAADPAEGYVWAVDRASIHLDAWLASTGALVASWPNITLDSAEHFPTPEVTATKILVEAGDEVDAVATPNQPQLRWHSAVLDGIIQSRPLVMNNVVVVATENDSLYGLNLKDLTTAWGPVSLGTPEPLSHVHTFPGLPSLCGDIDPLGITSNVVSDGTNVYAVGEVSTGSGSGTSPPVFKIIGVNPTNGTPVLPTTTIDPTNSLGMNTPAQQQRAGLAFGNGHVYVGFGGLAGDCGDYHGWLVSVNTSDGSVSGSLKIASQPFGAGAIWATAGPTVDGSGNVYAATGNAFNSPSPPGTDYSDAVVKMSAASLSAGPKTFPDDYFQPAEWRSDNNSDADLGSSSPVLLPNGSQLFILGKQHNAFLLNANLLGGSDHMTPVSRLNGVCPGVSDGQNAVIGHEAYVTCLNGGSSFLQEVNLP
jgi:hypothetical protein